MLSMFLCCATTFSQNTDYTKEQVENALIALNDIIKLYDGFIDRLTANSNTGNYVDILYWTDIVAAKKAGEDILNNPKAVEIFKVIQPSTMQMYHLDVFNQFEE